MNSAHTSHQRACPRRDAGGRLLSWTRRVWFFSLVWLFRMFSGRWQNYQLIIQDVVVMFFFPRVPHIQTRATVVPVGTAKSITEFVTCICVLNAQTELAVSAGVLQRLNCCSLERSRHKQGLFAAHSHQNGKPEMLTSATVHQKEYLRTAVLPGLDCQDAMHTGSVCTDDRHRCGQSKNRVIILPFAFSFDSRY